MSNYKTTPKAYIKLYYKLQERYFASQKFTQRDLLDIYKEYVIPRRKTNQDKIYTETELNSLANMWLDRALAKLVKQGWLGITFMKGFEKVGGVGGDRNIEFPSVIV